MRSGRLNQIVSLQRLELTEDEFGQEIKSWVEFDKVWAGIEATAATEPFAEDQMNTRQRCRIIMRYRDDMDMQCRIAHVDRAGVERLYEIKEQLPESFGGLYRSLNYECELLGGSPSASNA